MKRINIYLLVVFMLLSFLIVSPANAFFGSDVRKAKKLMDAGDYSQAISLLQKRIEKKSSDAEAHFQLGLCYVKTKKLSDADTSFTNALALKDEYGPKIGAELKTAGNSNFAAGSEKQALELYKMAIDYQPDLKPDIAQRTFNQSMEFFRMGKYDAADKKFFVATAFDNAMRQQISDMYFNLGNNANDKDCVGFYTRTANWDAKHNSAIGNRYLMISKSKINDKEFQEWRKRAARYVKVPPDFKVYPPGEYSFLLNSGEIMEHYIVFPPGKYTFHVTSDKNLFELHFDDGDIMPSKARQKPKKSKYKFRIRSLYQKQNFTLTVKE